MQPTADPVRPPEPLANLLIRYCTAFAHLKEISVSHTVLVEFQCAPGMGAGFLELLLPSLADTRAFEGCELIETYTDNANPDLVVLWERWATQENQEAYLAWRLETGMLGAIGPFMAGAPRFAHLTAAD